MRAGMDTGHVLARFEAERQALASMSPFRLQLDRKHQGAHVVVVHPAGAA